jgi:general secretion pathway protein E
MGIEEYLVASTVSIAIGQRLVRKICPICKEKTRLDPVLKEHLASENPKVFSDGEIVFYKGAGCNACSQSGYSGRGCINEVLVADEMIRKAILEKASADVIKKVAIAGGMTTMFEDGLKKVKAGQTTLEEVLRVVHE